MRRHFKSHIFIVDQWKSSFRFQNTTNNCWICDEKISIYFYDGLKDLTCPKQYVLVQNCFGPIKDTAKVALKFQDSLIAPSTTDTYSKCTPVVLTLSSFPFPILPPHANCSIHMLVINHWQRRFTNMKQKGSSVTSSHINCDILTSHIGYISAACFWIHRKKFKLKFHLVFLYVQKQTTDQLLICNQYVTLKCHKPYEMK